MRNPERQFEPQNIEVKNDSKNEESLPWYVEEKASKDLENLRVLRWFGPEQKDVNFSDMDYEGATKILKQLDYSYFSPAAKFFRESFIKEHADEKFTKKETEEISDYARSLMKNLINENNFSSKTVKETNYSPFGEITGTINKGSRSPEDLVRIYFAPKLHKEDLKFFLEQITENIKDLNADFKLYPSDWFNERKGEPDKFETNKDLNRFIVYMDRENSEDISKLMRRLAENKELFGHLEDSGEWTESCRIPLAKGINFVEGDSHSWDTGNGQVVRKLKKIIQGTDDDEIKLWRSSVEYNSPKIKESVQKKSLSPLGRSTKMPALRLNS